MKTKITSLIRTVALAALVAIAAPSATAKSDDMTNQPDGVVTVQFDNMKKFTDFGSQYLPTESNQRYLAKILREEIQGIAPHYIPADHHLTLRFLDINMAGEFESERGPELDGVRIVRGIYRPSFHVEYRVTDEMGNVISSGQRRISDLAFREVISFRRDEPLFYETELARDLISDISRTF